MCANPQKENGFTPIANEIMEALASTKLTMLEHQALYLILRNTYGYQRKTWKVKKWKEFGNIGIHKCMIKTTLETLAERKIISLDWDNKEIEFLKNYEIWQGYKSRKLVKLLTRKVSQATNLKVSHTTNQELVTQLTQVSQATNILTFENGNKPLTDKALEGVSFLPKEKKERKKENFKEISLAKSVQGPVPGNFEIETKSESKSGNNSEKESEEQTDKEFDQECYNIGRKLVEEFYPFYFTNNQGGVMNTEKQKMLITIGFAWNCYDPDLTKSVIAEVAGKLEKPSNLLAWTSERLNKIMKGEDDGARAFNRNNGKR